MSTDDDQTLTRKSSEKEQRISTRRAGLCVALLVLLGFSLGSSEFAVIGIEPELSEAFGVSLARVGELISCFSITYAVCTPLLAVATGRFRRFTLLVAYAAIFALSNLAMALSPTFEVLLASRIMLGAVSGAFLAVGVTFIPELVEAKSASLVISVVYAAFSVAMVVATSAGKMLAQAAGWHAVMDATFIFSLVVGLALVLVLPRSGNTDESATAREQAAILLEPQVLCTMAIFVFGVGSVYVFYGYISPYLESFLGMDAFSTSAVLMAYGVVCFFSNLLSGWADSRFGIRALVPSFIVQAILLLALWLVGTSFPVALAPVLLIGLSMYVVSVPCVSLFMRVARQRHPKALTLASSLEPMSFNCGIAFGTAVGGVVVSGPGLGAVGLVGGAFSFVACALVILDLLIGHGIRARQSSPAA